MPIILPEKKIHAKKDIDAVRFYINFALLASCIATCPIDSRGQSKKSIEIVNGIRKVYAERVLLNMVLTYYS